MASYIPSPNRKMWSGPEFPLTPGQQQKATLAGARLLWIRVPLSTHGISAHGRGSTLLHGTWDSSPTGVSRATGWHLSEGLHRIRSPTVEASLPLRLETSPSSRWGKSQKRHHGPETSCPTSDKSWTPEAPTFCEVLSVLNSPGSSATSVWPRKPLHVCWPETCHQEAPSDWAWETLLID